ncbi:hypothetical protein CW751_12375 [Brumimicrobium salinarum]|uniref:Secretion system C-terminal sorting domain-containing protein n=1 Tax=Brumimicrobium salinarum TaxID=2058658 RepID=A0A2I0R0B2_9FLAO|nr:T9SS type A sorting domain-containing protein [Brumimicrobium salinarum]PKR80013.1 hypothetical protein CW751_12375 [Brumimicrobium salinarum]
MKKIYLSALALVLGVGINAQVSNPSFENWTTGTPDDWTTLNAVTGIGTVTDENSDPVTPALEVTTGATDGNSFITLTSFNLAGSSNTQVPDGDYGSIATQDINSTDKYEDFSVDVMYDIKANDTAVITLQAYDASDNLVGVGIEVFAGTQATFTTVTIPMQYIGTVASYTMFIASSEGQIFQQSANSTIGVGSKLSVDNIVLGTVLSEADPATNIVASDISDNGDGSDLQVTFDAAADESTVSEYRVIVMEQGVALTDWSAVPAQLYTAVAPDGSANYSVTLTSADQYLASAGGNSVAPQAIVEDEAMDVYIYSIADGTNATTNQIAGPSNTITLTSATSSLLSLTKTINVYPNPATNVVNFKVDGLENGKIVINSITGQEVVNTTISNSKQVDVSNLNNGVYIYTVSNVNGEVVKTNKLVISK